MGTIKYFEDIEAWQTARKLTLVISSTTNKKPFSRDLGLTSQIRRAAVSISSNIAEGFESETDRAFIKYLCIAKSSAGELRSQLYTALDQNYISEKEFIVMNELCRKVSSQISKFIKYLQQSLENE